MYFYFKNENTVFSRFLEAEKLKNDFICIKNILYNVTKLFLFYNIVEKLDKIKNLFKEGKSIKGKIIIVVLSIIILLSLIQSGFRTITAIKDFFEKYKPSIVIINNYKNCIIIK